ncbi:MAG TPA: hypothetical protein VKR32_10645 [Puia sp.]|nr:hypothetical protein [Puia sp.]
MQGNRLSNRDSTIVVMFGALFGLALFCPCGKTTTDLKTDNTATMERIADLLEGNRICGSIRSSENISQLVLNYQNGTKLIIIDKLPSVDEEYISRVQAADLIISKCGVVLRDLSNNTLILMENNDSTSIARFNSVRSIISDNYTSTRIFGVTTVNKDNSY